MTTKIKNPYKLFLPFLIIYIIMIIIYLIKSKIGHFGGEGDEWRQFIYAKDLLQDREIGHLYGDEWRHLVYAKNLLQGFYVPKGTMYLYNGPGYPLFLALFLFFKTPLMLIALTNAFFQYLSLVFMYKTILYTTNKKYALYISISWGLILILSFRRMSWLLTEPMVFFLISAFIYYFFIYFKTKKLTNLLLASILFGWLALTKVVFVYFIVIFIIIGIVSWLFYKIFKIQYLKNVSSLIKIFSLSFIILIPYLIYTYSITKRPFELGTNGGLNIYWVTSPYQNESGNATFIWEDESFFNKKNCNHSMCTLYKECYLNTTYKNHLSHFILLRGKNELQRDSMYKTWALQNIKNNPVKYIKNCLRNFSRLWFAFPNDYQLISFSEILRTLPHLLIFILWIIVFIIWIFKSRFLPLEINFISILYHLFIISCTIFVNESFRFLYVSFPILFVFIAIILYRFVRIKNINQLIVKN